MASSPTMAALMAVLVVATGVLALVLAGGSGFQTSGGGGSRPSAVTSATPLGPIFLVNAQTVKYSTVPGPGGASTTTGVLVPVQGLKFIIQGLELSPGTKGRIVTYAVVTNSTGMGELQVPRGNFTVAAAGPNFVLTEKLAFKPGTITFLDLQIIPTYNEVIGLSVSNQDTLSGVESTASIYAEVPGNVSYAPKIQTQLVGYSSSQAASSLGVTVVGSYDTPRGTLVVLTPDQAYPSLPLSGLVLVQYRTNSTVTYIAA